ncbi:ankyrin repeat domain-containing protein [Paracidovorax citrulli]
MSAKQQLFEAIYAGDVETAAAVWRANKLDPNITSSVTGIGGHPVLGYVVQVGGHDLARELIASGADVNKRGEDGATPIWQATDAEGVQILHEAGADVNVRLTRGGQMFSRGATALHRAAKSQNPELIAALIRAGANVNAYDRDGVTPLHYAAVTDPENVRILVQAGADLDARDKSGNTPRSHLARQFPGFELAAAAAEETAEKQVAASQSDLEKGPARGTVSQNAPVQTIRGEYHYTGTRDGVPTFAFVPSTGSLDEMVQIEGIGELGAHLLDNEPNAAAREATYAALTHAHSAALERAESIALPALEEVENSTAAAAMTEPSVVEEVENTISQANVGAGAEQQSPSDDHEEQSPLAAVNLENNNTIQPAPGLRVKSSGEHVEVDAIARAPGRGADGTGKVVERAPTVAANGPATLLNGRFIRRENGQYFRVAEGQESKRVALVDEADKIRFVDKQMDAFQAAIELATHKGWEAILVTGTEKFRSEAWHHAKMAGLEVVGYEPTEKDLATLATARARTSELQPHAQRGLDNAQALADSLNAANDYVLKTGAGVQALNLKDGRYVGKILHETEHHVVQDLGKKVSVVHEKGRLDPGQLKKALEARGHIGMQYSAGRAVVDVAAGRSQSQALAR